MSLRGTNEVSDEAIPLSNQRVKLLYNLNRSNTILSANTNGIAAALSSSSGFTNETPTSSFDGLAMTLCLDVLGQPHLHFNMRDSGFDERFAVRFISERLVESDRVALGVHL